DYLPVYPETVLRAKARHPEPAFGSISALDAMPQSQVSRGCVATARRRIDPLADATAGPLLFGASRPRRGPRFRCSDVPPGGRRASELPRLAIRARHYEQTPSGA